MKKFLESGIAVKFHFKKSIYSLLVHNKAYPVFVKNTIPWLLFVFIRRMRQKAREKTGCQAIFSGENKTHSHNFIPATGIDAGWNLQTQIH